MFGLNPDGWDKPIKLLDEGKFNQTLERSIDHPIKDIHIVNLDYDCIVQMKKDLRAPLLIAYVFCVFKKALLKKII